MNLKTFIDRPILSLVISIFIVMVGVIGLSVLPVEQYPDIAPPTIRVSTTYSGANATAVQNSVIGSHQRCGEHDIHDFRRLQYR